MKWTCKVTALANFRVQEDISVAGKIKKHAWKKGRDIVKFS